MHWDSSRAPDLDCTDLQTKVLGWFLFESSLLTSACRPFPVAERSPAHGHGAMSYSRPQCAPEAASRRCG